MKKIRLLKDYDEFITIFKSGEIFEENEPYQGFNDDGTFTICQGFKIYHTLEVEDFEIILEN